VTSGRWLAGLQQAAQERLPAPVRAYVEAGAGDELSLREATSAWSSYRLAPRVLRGIEPDLRVRLLGQEYAVPVGIAPTAMQRAAHDDGELAMVSAAAEAGAPVVVPILAGHRFADIGARAARWWLQVYLPTDRDSAAPVIEAALEAGAGALVLTVDTPVVGTKHAVSDDDWSGLDTSWHGCNWPVDNPHPWARDLTPDDLHWLRERFAVPIVAKGVLRADDAHRCVDAGAAAIWVSSHGARQLDRSVSTADALARIACEVGSRAEVYVDGGIRFGIDVVTAAALGASAAFVGRPALYALAVDGAVGVGRMLAELRAEIEEVMLLAGCADVRSAAGLLDPPQGPPPA
jgi:4-hydroxymandelate oxidase